MQNPVRPISETEGADDVVLAFRTLRSRTQGRIVRLGAAVDKILSGHSYPDPVNQTLGEAVALTAMLGSLLHANGRLILQTKTNGPLRMLVVDFTTPGNIRGLASFDAERIAAMTDGKPIPQGALLGSGHLAMTIDPGGGKPRTQGIVGLTGGTLSDAALAYFRQSEQIPTLVRLAVARHATMSTGSGNAGWHWRAGGIILQQLPEDVGTAPELDPEQLAKDEENGVLAGDRDEDWQRARMLAATVEDHELIDPTLAPERLLYRLLGEEGVRLGDARSITAKCSCSHERVIGLLKGFGKDELADMREPDGGVSVTCEYCSTRYAFTPDDIASLGD